MTNAETNRDYRAERNAEFQRVCAEVIACMGPDWVQVSEERETYHSVFMARHTPSGFEISFCSGTYSCTYGRGQVSIVWPKNDQGRHWALRDLPGPQWRYDSVAPEATFSITRPAASIAKQVLRRIFTDEMRSAHSAMLQRNAERADIKAQAEAWVHTVAGALGTTAIHGGLSPYHSKNVLYLAKQHKFVSLEYSGDYPGGSATVRLPKDPEKAAAIVAAIRAACDEHSGE